jgi:hypothetical protein
MPNRRLFEVRDAQPHSGVQALKEKGALAVLDPWRSLPDAPEQPCGRTSLELQVDQQASLTAQGADDKFACAPRIERAQIPAEVLRLRPRWLNERPA